MDRLGLDIPLQTFNNLDLPDIRKLLELHVRQNASENMNGWAENALAYAEDVKATREKIAKLIARGENLNDHGFLKQFTKDLHRLQKKYDKKNKHNRSLEGKFGVVFSTMQGMGGVISCAPPLSVAGAVLAGAGKLGEIGLGFISNNSQKRYQKRQTKLKNQYEQVANTGEVLQNARNINQNQLFNLLHRQQEEWDFLLNCEGYLTPLQRAKFIDGVLTVDIPGKMEQAQGEKEKLETEIEDWDKIIETYENWEKGIVPKNFRKLGKYHNWHLTDKGKKALALKILEAKGKRDLAKTQLDITTQTLENLQFQQKQFDQEKKDIEEDRKKPIHMQQTAGTLTVEQARAASKDYINQIAPFKDSQVMTERVEYFDAEILDASLDTACNYRQLKGLEDSDLSKYAPGLITANVNNMARLQICKKTNDQAIQSVATKEDALREQLKGLSGDDAIKVEEELAFQTKIRLNLQEKGAAIEHGLNLGVQTSHYLQNRLQQLPPTMRSEICHAVLSSFSKLPPEEQLKSIREGSFSLAGWHQMECSAEWDQIRIGGDITPIYENCRRRRAETDQMIENVRNSDLSEDDKNVEIAKHEQDARFLDTHFDGVVIGTAQKELRAVSKWLSGDRTNSPLTEGLVSTLRQHLA
ncbi:MAG: hypothetical protein H0U49_01920, partial [Parachlamydiaceae bacterium]|nr:hypothetical protein [Parachlamydiaceae bacterium]